MHTTISPAILYWGSIVVLITTENEDGTPNIAPMSSAWWLGHRCMIGLDASSKTTENLLRTKQCVLNLATDSMGANINALSHTTGTEIVNPSKLTRGYRHVKDKFGVSGLTPTTSDLVTPPGIKECPVQMESELAGVHKMMQDVSDLSGAILAIELKILRVHVEESLKLEGHENRVDPDKWHPIISNFQDLYGLNEDKAVVSKLATIQEELYRPFTA
ncbi:uncharacterized protein LY89DRAFT_684987 [Mollisia scopiformis]|uniref:Flavin reductase like domain-containing protein n=1 Tax=Mollisia scopiformis TaxID=149040 RepID=A0A194XA06_MOLSC|nr:uncharacterized protein LY89DRAFT_684987 [Mollisia scopiformis]KUJ16998.1 hypothetical protein LY89DRAFT_684987 [Mollisia scopiformis]